MDMTDTMRRFVEGTPKRNMGSETEFTTRFSSSIDQRIDPEIVAYYSDPNRLWLKNGGLLYKDYGGVIEYATPECTSGSAVALHERIGEFVVDGLGDVIAGSDAEGGVPSKQFFHDKPWPVYKRTGYGDVTSHEEGEDISILTSQLSTGHHETYQTGIDFNRFTDSISRRFIMSYLATRPVWSGAGMVASDGYRLSQKAEAIDFAGDDLVAHGHKIPMRYQGSGLLEIRTGEGNMSEWAITTKFDMTSLVLRLVEHGQVPHNLLVKAGFETITMRAASIDPESSVISDYDEMTALAHQQAIAEAALGFAQKYDVPKAELNAARQVIAACKQIQAYLHGQEDLSILSDRIDWAAKLDKLRTRKLTLGTFTTSNLVAVYHDLSWEDTSENGPARRWYRKKGNATITLADVRRNRNVPPSSRARERARLLKEIAPHFIRQVDWDHVATRDDNTYAIGE